MFVEGMFSVSFGDVFLRWLFTLFMFLFDCLCLRDSVIPNSSICNHMRRLAFNSWDHCLVRTNIFQGLERPIYKLEHMC